MSAPILATDWEPEPLPGDTFDIQPAQPPVDPTNSGPVGSSAGEPVMEDAAFHGLAGAIVRRLEPHTEADSRAMLVQFLVAFGNCLGRGPHVRVEDTEHHACEYVIVVGRSSKARKGTSFNRIDALLEAADPAWRRGCHAHGLVSGEGIVHAIRDDAPGKKDGEMIEGVKDKRLLIVEEEFGGALAAAARKENTLTATLRSAWDGKDLRTLAKNSHERATAPHVSIIGHITVDELKAKLRDDALSNGFANRFLWVYATRARLLPDGGTLRAGDLFLEAEALKKAVALARTFGELRRDGEAAELWRAEYSRVSEERSGTVGAVTSRMEAHAVRLSLIYALLDGSPVIRVPHLRAALAVCDYCRWSAEQFFGGLSVNAQTILTGLTACFPNWLARTAITKVIFSGHISAANLEAALEELRIAGLVYRTVEDTAGAPRELWQAAKKAN
jgi:hypothetical protein